MDISQPKSSLSPSTSNQMESGTILKQLVLKGITSQLVTAQVFCKYLFKYIDLYYIVCDHLSLDSDR